MKQKNIKTLAEASFTDNEIDEKRVNMIAAKLKRKDLRTYIKALRLVQQQHTVTVEMPTAVDESAQQDLQLRFPDKKIIYSINKDILAGMRIIDNDLLYDFSLQNKIDKAVKHLYETND